MTNLLLGTFSEVLSKSGKIKNFLVTEHTIFFILFQSPHSWFITSSNFTIWGQIGLLKNAWTWLRSPILDENAFLMLQHERMRARSCHCGLKEMPCFMTCKTVTNLGTLDTAHFIRGRHKHRKPQCCFSQPRRWAQGDRDTWPTGWLG